MNTVSASIGVSLSDSVKSKKRTERRYFIGGSDAHIIMGRDEDALLRLWREKRGEAEPEDLSGNLVVQLGLATEDLNRRWYQANTGQVLTDVQRQIRHPALRWMAATLDGRVQGSDAVFEAKFMLPWSFSEEAAAEKYMPQLQHNMWVVVARTAVLSVITGGGKWVEITTHADPLYQHLIVTAERKFWRCVESGEPPRLFGVEPPRPRIEAIRRRKPTKRVQQRIKKTTSMVVGPSLFSGLQSVVQRKRAQWLLSGCLTQKDRRRCVIN
jgi:predicted phage-related endonuclease